MSFIEAASALGLFTRLTHLLGVYDANSPTTSQSLPTLPDSPRRSYTNTLHPNPRTGDLRTTSNHAVMLVNEDDPGHVGPR